MREHDVGPDKTTVGAAATAILNEYPVADVSIYLNTLLWQDPEAWAALQGVPEMHA